MPLWKSAPTACWCLDQQCHFMSHLFNCAGEQWEFYSAELLYGNKLIGGDCSLAKQRMWWYASGCHEKFCSHQDNAKKRIISDAGLPGQQCVAHTLQLAANMVFWLGDVSAASAALEKTRCAASDIQVEKCLCLDQIKRLSEKIK